MLVIITVIITLFRQKKFIVVSKLINVKGQLRRKMNLWSNYTLLPSQPLSEICFHDCQM